MRWFSVVALCGMAACAVAPPSARRWPDHRKEKDAAIVELQKRAEQLEARVAALTMELDNMRAQLAKLAASPSPSPAAPPP